MKQHYIVEGEYLGSGMRVDYSTVGTSLEVFSYAFFCKKCGRIWASCPIERPGDFVEFQLLNVICPKDTKDSFERMHGGSIWVSYDKEFIAAFPPAVISREFNWLLEKFKEYA